MALEVDVEVCALVLQSLQGIQLSAERVYVQHGGAATTLAVRPLLRASGW